MKYFLLVCESIENWKQFKAQDPDLKKSAFLLDIVSRSAYFYAWFYFFHPNTAAANQQASL